MTAFQIVEWFLRTMSEGLLVIGTVGAVVSGILFATRLLLVIQQHLHSNEKRKNQSPYDKFSVPYDQDIDDEKPKRQTYMTIGDDGELVEMDE